MALPQVDEQILKAYPKLYYLLPCIRRHKRKFEDYTFWFDEPMDAMLWFLELIASQTSGASCTRSKLKGLVCRWYGKEASTAFNRSYKVLDKGSFITWEPNAQDNKKHDVWITEKGRRLLADIKSQRLKDLTAPRQVIENLSAEEQQLLLRIINLQAEAAWVEMLAVEEFQDIANANQRKIKVKAKGKRRPHARKRGTSR